MANPGRKSNWNKLAGERLRLALRIIGLATKDLCADRRWTLSKNPVTIRNWFKKGIPDETDKIEQVAQFLKISREALLSFLEREFIAAIKNAWGVTTEKDAPIIDIFPTCAQYHCICDSITKAANCIDAMGKNWLSQDMPYSLVLKFGECAFLQLQDTNIITAVKSEAGQALGMLTAIHYNAAWEKWTPLNYSSRIAIDALLRSLEQKYWRVRFRSLYVLQFVDQILLEHLIRKYENRFTNETLTSIHNHVFHQGVVQYIRLIAETTVDHNIKHKAMQVLSEITFFCNDPNEFTLPI